VNSTVVKSAKKAAPKKVAESKNSNGTSYTHEGSHFAMHKMVTRIALDFVNIPAGELGERIQMALADIGYFTGADRVYIFSYDFENRQFSNTCEWCAKGISPEIDNLQNIPFDNANGLIERHAIGETVYIPFVNRLNEDSKLKKLLQSQGIRSMIGIPMMYHSECIGFVGLDSVKESREWDENEITILRLFADLLANAETRKRNELRIRQGENRHQALLRALPDLMFRLSGSGKILELYASDPDDITASPDLATEYDIREILPGPVAEQCLVHLKKVCRTGESSRFEYQYYEKGPARYYEARVVKSDTDEVIFVIRNITEKKLTDERLKLITSNIPGAIYTFTLCPDGSFNLPYISESILDLAGLPASEIKSDITTVFTRIHDECKPSLLNSIRKSALKLTPWRSEFRVRNSENKWIWVQADSTPHTEADGTITWYGHVRDITERRASEESLVQKKAYLTAVIENQIGFIWLKDLDGRFILVNRKFAEACKFTSTDELIGKTEYDINPARRARKYVSQDQKVIRTGKNLVTLEKIRTEAGEQWYETFKSPVIDQNGAVIGTTGFAIDVTERKRKVEQVRRLNRRLNDINIQKDKLFSILAHDLRNPFSGSIGMFEMILTESDNLSADEIREYIALLYENTLSTYSMVENLLEWSRTQRNRMNHTPEHIRLKVLVDQAFEVLSNSAMNKQVDLQNLVTHSESVYADRDMLHTILRNLITNGIKFTKNGGSVRIESRRNGRMLEIDVTDTGIGICEKEMQKLFRIDYVPSSRGTNGEKGSGLGLQICKEFTEKHGGCLDVLSKPGHGSTFRISLPHRSLKKKAGK
jgi:PAS domain S-box-containing protein